MNRFNVKKQTKYNQCNRAMLFPTLKTKSNKKGPEKEDLDLKVCEEYF